MYQQILSQIGSYASLIGLLITVYVAYQLRQIRNTYIFRVRAPEFIKLLSRRASKLIELGGDFDNSQQSIGLEIAVADVTLRTMQSRMRGQSRRAVKQLRNSIKDYRQNPDRDKIYRLYTEIHTVIEEVKELQKELNLE